MSVSGALCFDLPRVLAFVRQHVPGLLFVEGMTAIGWEREGRLVAGCVFENYNTRNVFVHLAGEPGRRWLARPFLSAVMRYVFQIMGCARLSAWIDESNAASRRFTERFGFRLEARLKGAASDGGDILIYVLPKEECRHAFE